MSAANIFLTSLLLASAATASAEELPACDFGDDGVWLVTVTPGPTPWSTFGHSALLIHHKASGVRGVFNYGTFDGNDPWLIWGFLMNTQDYLLEGLTLDYSLERWSGHNRGAVAQELSMPRPWRDALINQVFIDNQPENAYYRYHWYNTNCTTKVRDLFDQASFGQFEPQQRVPTEHTPRSQVLRHSGYWWPIWLGLHWGAGRHADTPLDRWDAMFMPSTLHQAAGEATFVWPDGVARDLVTNECRLLTPSTPRITPTPPNRDGLFALLGLLAAGLIGLTGRADPQRGLASAGVLGAGLAIWGSAALLIGILGTFAPFWSHHNQWFASPLTFGLPIAALVARRNSVSPWPSRLTVGLLGLAVAGLALSLVRGLADHNLGVALLALPPLGAAVWCARRLQ